MRAAFFIFLLFLARGIPFAGAEPGTKPAGPKGLPAIAGMENLKAESWGELVPEYSLEVTAAGPSPADLTNRGLYQLQLFRSPQAARHFLTALREDDSCPMAWVGLYLALLERGDEAREIREECYRRANLLRIRTNPHEQKWVDALAALHLRGVRAFAAALDGIRKAHPDDRNAQVWLPLMLRDGHDLAGEPRVGQKAARALLAILLEKYPEDPVVLHAWCQLALVGPNPDEALGQARLLLALSPPSAYFRQVAGMVLYRSGDAAAAAAALDDARRFEEKSLAEEGISPVAAPTYFDNLDMLAMSLVEAGRKEDALALARAARQIDLPTGLPPSAATREFGFFTLSAEARVHARAGEWRQAIHSLPPLDHPVLTSSPFFARSMECLRLYLEGQLALESGQAAAAKEILKKLETAFAHLGELAEPAKKAGMEPQFAEVFRLADFLQYDLRAGVSFLSGDRTMAAMWWRTATGRQISGASRAIPRWPRGAAESMAATFGRAGDFPTAVRAWEQAVRERPQSGWALRGLRDTRAKTGDREGKEAAARALASVWAAADEDLRRTDGGEKNEN
jgi:tetratricopeptide (TPR) repeat protein